MKTCYLALSIFLLNPTKLCSPINYFTAAVTKELSTIVRKESHTLHVQEQKKTNLTAFETWASNFQL